MARQPVRITDLSTDTVEVRDTTPTSTAMGLVVRVSGTAAVAATPEASTWCSVVSSTNATATATRAGSAGARLYVTTIAASFNSPPTVNRRMDLREGASNRFSVFIADPFNHSFASPIELAVGATANLVLVAGGTGVVGLVSMCGYSI